MSKNRSPNSLPEGHHFKHVNILKMGSSNLFGLSVGVFNSYVGYDTCKACGITTSHGIDLKTAIAFGTKLDAWLEKQENTK